MKVAIVGYREFNDYKLLKAVIDSLHLNITTILSGKARGADTLGEQYARENNIPVIDYPADWDKHGKGAGHIRNSLMAKDADVVIAFWNGESRGTKDMITRTLKANILCYILNTSEPYINLENRTFILKSNKGLFDEYHN